MPSKNFGYSQLIMLGPTNWPISDFRGTLHASQWR